MSRSKPQSVYLDRREFLLAAGTAAVAYAPLLAAAHAAPAPHDPPAAANAVLEDWTIDDMWGVYPRYSEAIGFAPPHDAPALVAQVAAVDEGFIFG